MTAIFDSNPASSVVRVAGSTVGVDEDGIVITNAIALAAHSSRIQTNFSYPSILIGYSQEVSEITLRRKLSEHLMRPAIASYMARGKICKQKSSIECLFGYQYALTPTVTGGALGCIV